MVVMQNKSSSDFPPLDKVAAALADITERLACELGSPTEQAPAWGDFEWRIAQAVAAMQGVSSLLFERLRWKGPEGWQRFLSEQRDHIAGRHRSIVQLLGEIDRGARREGMPMVALKGSELHRRNLYAAGQRPMADVDLLVRDHHVEAAGRVLEAGGYTLTFSTWRHHLFETKFGQPMSVARLGEHVDNPIKIELHTSIRERLPIAETDITGFVFPASGTHDGLNPYPSAVALMMHLMLHAAGNMRAHALRLVQLHDIARLAEKFSLGDWHELLAARTNDRGLWWAAAPLLLTQRYYPATVPAFVLDGLSRQCPWPLRRSSRRQLLGDVSWTNLRVYAFPGIEWSRTPLEALRFVVSRLWPSADVRAELKRFSARHPGAASVPWYGISQVGRILRWTFSKPPRVQALLPVRAALAAPSEPPMAQP
jgi:hypothetical protein